MRKICYVTGTRADFGLMLRTLKLAQASDELEVALCVTGMHLSASHGNTAEEVRASGLRIGASVLVNLEAGTGAAMARAIGHALIGLTDAIESECPDVVLVLGDRGEMLAGALAAVHLNTPLVHIHGGERSGTVDEPVRHAISKLAHYHFVSSEAARARLVRMGERAENVFVTGAPGLDGLRENVTRRRDALCADHGFDSARPVALVVFHPVLQEAESAGEQTHALMSAAADAGLQCLAFAPNSDAGSPAVRAALEKFGDRAGIRLVTHLPREHYVSWMAAADVMVGNSSSGIIEAASFGLPVVNVGDRQDGRERSANVIDVAAEEAAIAAGIKQALRCGRRDCANVYGDGRAGERIVKLLASLPLDRSLLCKTNVY